MRAVKGQEAIEIARQQNVPLYDVFYRHEVTAAEAKQFLDSRRDPQSFVLENWPESDEEAEQVVMHRFHIALTKGQLRQARILDVIAHPNGGVRIHPHAATLAAHRLVEQGKLEVVESADADVVYRIVKNARLSEDFFSGLEPLVCEECAKLNFDRPFHETCLTIIMEHFHQRAEHLSDVMIIGGEMPLDSHRLTRFIKMNSQLLSRGLDEAKSRWQTVVKPKLTRREDSGEPDSKNPSGKTMNAASESRAAKATVHVKTQGAGKTAEQAPSGSQSKTDSANSTEQVWRPASIVMESDRAVDDAKRAASSPNTTASRSQSTANHGASASTPANSEQRIRITKGELIDYLREVEILDETGEVKELREHHELLAGELERREEMIHQLEKQQAFFTKQFDEMKRDMDTLLEAMQIARRRSPAATSEQVIDVPMGD